MSAAAAVASTRARSLSTPAVVQHVRAGRLKGLAVSGRTRSPLVPELPTIAEAGYPDLEYENYYVLAAPAGILNSVAALLETEVQQSLVDSGLQERFRAQDILIARAGSVDTRARIEAEARLWAKVVKATGMRID
jgi:tripartite-type tricarboxylate transporter receptor subunit TctC